MSKNERLARSLVAGLVFAAIGIFAAVKFDSTSRPEITRAPASRNCGSTACLELVRLKAEVLSAPSSQKVTNRKSAAKLEAREAKLLGEAGAILIAIFRGREISEVPMDELTEAVHFLVETYDYDGAGVALDVLELGLGPAKTSLALAAIDSRLKELDASNALKEGQYEPFQLGLNANRSQGEPEVPPAKSGQ